MFGNLTITIKTTDHSTIDHYFNYLRDKTGIHTTSTYEKYQTIFRTYYVTIYVIQGADGRRKQIIVNDIYDLLRGNSNVFNTSRFEFNELEKWCIDKTVEKHRFNYNKNKTTDVVLFDKRIGIGRYMYYSDWATGRRKEYNYNTFRSYEPLGEYYLKRFSQIFENGRYKVLVKLGDQYDNELAGFAYEHLEYHRKHLEGLMIS